MTLIIGYTQPHYPVQLIHIQMGADMLSQPVKSIGLTASEWKNGMDWLQPFKAANRVQPFPAKFIIVKNPVDVRPPYLTVVGYGTIYSIV